MAVEFHFVFVINVDNIEVAKPLPGYDVVGIGIELGALLGDRLLRDSVVDAVRAAFGGNTDDQEVGEIQPGSLDVLLHCFTDKRFREVLEDYQAGEIKERLQVELSQAGIKVEGLKVEIENMEEVEKIKAAINERISGSTDEMAEGVAGMTEEMESLGNISPRIIVQGGAYRSMPPDNKWEYKRATKESARKGYDILMNGGTAVEAVEAAVRDLENNEYFNAGYGSLLNNDGEVECDAMIMEGHTLRYGAVISGRHFKNPVSLSKIIMYESSHCALSGDGALQFAQRKGFPKCDPGELISELAREKVKVSYEDYLGYVKYYYGSKPLGKETHDTVSAVAMDTYGHLACAMSTGGLVGKLKGRVSDAPFIGCGGYVNNIGGATVTGFGEAIMKVTLARDVVYNMENGQNAQESAENALEKMKRLVNGHGGVVTIDKEGNFGKAFTTHMMVWASIKSNTMEFGMEKDEVEVELVKLNGEHK